MAVINLHDLHERHVRLADRSRSQWTFYQFLEAICKHLLQRSCPVSIDFPIVFGRLRDIANDFGAASANTALSEVEDLLFKNQAALVAADAAIPPSLLRRFFDRLGRRDERVLLAVIKFYIEAAPAIDDVIDKIDILLTRLVEIPRDGGGSIVRERSEIERLVRPLLQGSTAATIQDREVPILLEAISSLQLEAASATTFSELMSSKVLDTLRSLKRRLGNNLFHRDLLPPVLETTVCVKNRFRELWEDEELRLLDDTNRVFQLHRQLAAHPEIVTDELQEAFDSLAAVRQRVDSGRESENLRRSDISALRETLNQILERFDTDATFGLMDTDASPQSQPNLGEETFVPSDTLLSDQMNMIAFALEMAETSGPEDAYDGKHQSALLALESWEARAATEILSGRTLPGTIDHERSELYFRAAALRLRADDEAREINRLKERGSPRFAEILDAATATLQKAIEIDRRFGWFVDDILFRGDTRHFNELYRSRFRLMRAWAGLWLVHNEHGGTSPL